MFSDKAERKCKHESLEAVMPYFRSNAVENLPDVGGFGPRVNHLYTAFEQSEDELRISKLNKTLAEQAGLETGSIKNFKMKFVDINMA